jgi:hypothetical protein
VKDFIFVEKGDNMVNFFGILAIAVVLIQSCLLIYVLVQCSKREDDLVAALIAKHVGEFALAKSDMRTKIKEKIKKMQIENELAMANQKMFEEQGVPVS